MTMMNPFVTNNSFSLLTDIGHCQDAIVAYGAAALQKRSYDQAVATDMPVLTDTSIAPDQIHLAAVMYWLWNIERAGLPSFVETLADQVGKGYIVLPLTTSGSGLLTFWRDRARRFTALERENLFEQMFTVPRSPSGSTITQSLAAVVRILCELGAQPLQNPVSHLITNMMYAVQTLASELTFRTSGIVPFAAQEMLDTVSEAIKILQSSDLLRVLGARTIWEAIQRHAPYVLHREIEPSVHLARAQTGFRIIKWISGIAPDFGMVQRDDPFLRDAIAAAELWSANGGC